MSTSRTVFVAFLRGINFGGRRIVQMERLRTSLLSHNNAGFRGVKTWQAAGNVVVQTRETSTSAAVSATIRETLEKDFGWEDVPVMVRTLQQIEEVVANNPYQDTSKYSNPRLMFVAFLDHFPTSVNLQHFEEIDFCPDEYRIDQRLEVIYYYIATWKGCKLETCILEEHLQVPATTRVMRTVTKLAELSKLFADTSVGVVDHSVTKRDLSSTEGARRRKKRR